MNDYPLHILLASESLDETMEKLKISVSHEAVIMHLHRVLKEKQAELISTALLAAATSDEVKDECTFAIHFDDSEQAWYMLPIDEHGEPINWDGPHASWQDTFVAGAVQGMQHDAASIWNS